MKRVVRMTIVMAWIALLFFKGRCGPTIMANVTWGVRIKIWIGLRAMLLFRRTYGPPVVAPMFWGRRIIIWNGLRAFKGTDGPGGEFQARGRIPGVGETHRGQGVVFVVKPTLRAAGEASRELVPLTQPCSEPLFVVGVTMEVRRPLGIEGVTGRAVGPEAGDRPWSVGLHVPPGRRLLSLGLGQLRDACNEEDRRTLRKLLFQHQKVTVKISPVLSASASRGQRSSPFLG